MKVVYPDTGLSRETISSSSGVFRLSGLPIGACHVEVTATGFRAIKTETIVLSVGETRELDLTLEVGPVESTVEVRGVTEALVQNNAAVGDVLVSSQLDNLPVNGRDWKALMSLVPGAVDGQKFFATGGDDVNFHVDGVDASGVRDQNMKVYTRERDVARRRRGISGEHRLVQRRHGRHGRRAGRDRDEIGIERFPWIGLRVLAQRRHGRPKPVRSGGPSAVPVEPVRRHPGRTGDQNKTFFFLSYEGFRQALQTSLIGYVPTPLLRDRGRGRIAGSGAVRQRLSIAQRRPVELSRWPVDGPRVRIRRMRTWARSGWTTGSATA